MSCAQGIALSADPNYKVLGSAYPWIAQRLLSDKSPELQETLRALLYKGSKFQFGRLESLLRQAVKAPPRAATIAGSGKRAASPGERQPLTVILPRTAMAHSPRSTYTIQASHGLHEIAC